MAGMPVHVVSVNDYLTRRDADWMGPVYRFLGFELSTEARSRMQAFLDRHPQDKHGRHSYSLSEFGLDAQTEAARFRDYCDRFSIQMSTG